MKNLSLTILFIVSLQMLFSCGGTKGLSSSNDPKAILANAIQEGRSANYEEALKLYQKAIDLNPNYAEAYARRGSLLYSLERKNESLKDLKKSLELDPDFNRELYYSTGINSFDLGNYDQAILYFKEYQSRVETTSDKTMKVQDYINIAQIRQKLKDNPVPFVPVKVDGEVNTGTLEYLPSLTADAKTMVFTRRLNNQEDLYSAVKVEGKWISVAPLTDINTLDNEGGQTISKDGKTIIFTACNYRSGYGSCDLYISSLEDDRWSTPVNLGEGINTRSWEAHPSLNADGSILYFSSDRSGGFGARDIWMSQKEEDGLWSAPVNAGESVNGKYNEESPFIHIDGHTLYLRSDRIQGMGSFDIFYTKRVNRKSESIKNFTWSPLENMGYPINTEGNEGALVIEQDGVTGYFASDIESRIAGQRAPNLDIYTFSIPEFARATPTSFISGKIIDGKTGEGLIAQYKIIALGNGDVLHEGSSDESGDVFMALPSGEDYAVIVEKEGYDYYSGHFDAEANERSDAINLDIVLSSLEKINTDKPIVLNNIFFETGSAVLDAKSDTEIGQLVRFLQSNPAVHILILGHTDDVGDDQANQLLSEQRAKAVYDKLIVAGINAGRLSFEGRGERQPIVSNSTAEGQKQNRRTEFMVVKN